MEARNRSTPGASGGPTGLGSVSATSLVSDPLVLSVAAPEAPRSRSTDSASGSESASALDRLLQLLGSLFTVAYPILVAASVAWLGARTAALVLLGLHVAMRLRTLRRDLERARGLLGLAALVAVLLALAAILDDARYLLAYPSLVSLALLAYFGWSLRGIPVVERFARMEAGAEELDEAALRYCRRVTVVWCAFFVVNGGIATALAVWASRGVWAVYTGGVSYVLVGLVFAVEYVVRRARFGRFGTGLVDRILARLLSSGAEVPR